MGRDNFERCDVGSHVNVILTYGGLVESGPIYGMFAEAADLYADDPDSAAIGIVGEESLTADQRDMALRNSERLAGTETKRLERLADLAGYERIEWDSAEGCYVGYGASNPSDRSRDDVGACYLGTDLDELDRHYR